MVDAYVHDGSVRRTARLSSNEQRQSLLAITSALASAVTPDHVYESVVDNVATALGASTVALWLVDDDGRTARLVRQHGYSPKAAGAFLAMAIDGAPTIPALDAIRRGESIWIPSQQALLRDYPHLAPTVTPGRAYRVACLPLIAGERILGSLGMSIDEERDISEDERAFLLLVARYASQALERLRLQAETDAARARAEQLYGFANAAVAAGTVEQVYEAALQAITKTMHTDRASVLLADASGTMRFVAWRGLSETYRLAVDGHSPWPRDAVAPAPVLVADAVADPAYASYREVFEAERIGALAFIPLVSDGRLIGKFMVYYAAPYAFTASDLAVASAIANHLASMIARFQAVAELERTIRDNELFAGVLAHDLRNPLNAIVTAAQLVLTRHNVDPHRPAAHILASTGRMTRMIDQLLDFTRARVGGGIEIHRCATSLADLVRQAVAELELVHPEQRFDVSVSGDHLGAWDPDRLMQVVSNLAANAQQHGAAGSPIEIAVDGGAAASVALTIHNAGTIPAALMPALFDPFHNQRYRGDTRGLGLGLYIVHEIVRAHGGTVDVVSSANIGTTFTVRLPRAAG